MPDNQEHIDKLNKKYTPYFDLISKGYSDHALLDALESSQKALRIAKAAYITLYPQNADQMIKLAPTTKRYLVDECVPPALSLLVSQEFGWAPNVEHLGKGGTKDPELFAYAVREGYDAIFTMDKVRRLHERINPFDSNDLTTISTAYGIEAIMAEKDKGIRYRGVETRKVPMIIQLDTSSRSIRAISKALVKHKDKINFALIERPSPYITVEDNHVRIGPSYKHIFQEFFGPGIYKMSGEFNRSRIEAWAEGWTKKIIASYGGNNLSKRKMKKIKDENLARAEQVYFSTKSGRPPKLIH